MTLAKPSYFFIGLLSIITFLTLSFQQLQAHETKVENVTIAILVKDKAHTLPLYLSCLEKQTWPKEKTYLYIRTNNNNDESAILLREWVNRVGEAYAGVYFDDSDVEQPVQNFRQHEWNSMRFKVLGKIRQDSLDWAKEHHSHYFVADCDNFIHPHTLEKILKTNLPIVAPFLRVGDPSAYSNYHAAVDENGYFQNSPLYFSILHRQICGLIQLPVVHCTYLVRHEVLDKLFYDDNSFRYEYVIFSDSARKNDIPQYLDNREVYGRITFAESKEEFANEPWLLEFADPNQKAELVFTKIYDNRIWDINAQGKGSSGSGSRPESTRIYRAFLENFLREKNIKSVVDAGCGDWESSQLIDWSGIHYTGYDVVKRVIEENNQNFGTPTIKFIHANFNQIDLPRADLLICKEVFQHLPNKDILEFIPKLKNFKYCLLIDDSEAPTPYLINNDIQVGDFRTLDLTKPPFNVNAEKVLTYTSGVCVKQLLFIDNCGEYE